MKACIGASLTFRVPASSPKHFWTCIRVQKSCCPQTVPYMYLPQGCHIASLVVNGLTFLQPTYVPCIRMHMHALI